MEILGRNRTGQPIRIAHDGDNAVPGEIYGGHENAIVGDIQGPLSERGGGDMSDNRHGPWIEVRHQNVNYCRIRLLSVSMNVLMLILIPLMILSLFILLNIGIAVLHRLAFQDLDIGLKFKIVETINRGYLTSQYIHEMNEALHEALSKKPSADVLHDIHNLNQKYENIVEYIQRLIFSMNNEEEKGNQEHHL